MHAIELMCNSSPHSLHALLQAFPPLTNKTIKAAVKLWCTNREEAAAIFGDIGGWDVSQVTDMVFLFDGQTDFNDDISRWQVAGVTDMYGMFNGASSFNQPLGDWQVAGVTDMTAMFHDASSFNQPLGDWNVAGVTDMRGMFNGAGAMQAQPGTAIKWHHLALPRIHICDTSRLNWMSAAWPVPIVNS